MTGAQRRRLGDGVAGDRGEVHGCVRLLAAGVRAREQQEVGDEPAHAPRGAQRGLRRLAALAVELVGEQLEVREHARQRRAQLVGCVGDELALAQQRVLGLQARILERLEHLVEGARELADLVVARRLRDVPAGVARPGDVARRRGEGRDRAQRALRQGESSEQREQRSGEHAEREERAHACDGLLEVLERPCVLAPDDDAHGGVLDGDEAAPRLDEVPADLTRADVDRRAEIRAVRRRRPRDRRLQPVEQADRRTVRQRVVVDARRDEHELVCGRPVDPYAQPVLQAAGGVRGLAAEVRADLRGRELPDDDGEEQQDHERQGRGDQRQAPADRETLKHGGRTPHRGSCAGAAARRRPRACGAGWRRTPRSCSWWRTGRSPRPPRGGADAGSRSARCA